MFVLKTRSAGVWRSLTYPSLNLRLRATALFLIISDTSRPPELSPSDAEAISGSVFMGSLSWGGLPKFVRLRTKLTVSSCWFDDDATKPVEVIGKAADVVEADMFVDGCSSRTASLVVADLRRFETEAFCEDFRRFFNSLLRALGIRPTPPITDDFDFKIPRGASNADEVAVAPVDEDAVLKRIKKRN